MRRSQRPAPLQLLARGDAAGRAARVALDLARGDSVGRHDEQEEENGQDRKALGGAGDDAVIPGEEGQLVEAGDEVPARGDVASDEDAERDGEGVHAGNQGWGSAKRVGCGLAGEGMSSGALGEGIGAAGSVL